MYIYIYLYNNLNIFYIHFRRTFIALIQLPLNKKAIRKRKRTFPTPADESQNKAERMKSTSSKTPERSSSHDYEKPYMPPNKRGCIHNENEEVCSRVDRQTPPPLKHSAFSPCFAAQTTFNGGGSLRSRSEDRFIPPPISASSR